MTNENGWITLYRKITEWEWYTDINTCHLFIYCLLKANHKTKNWRGIKIKRGTFITSLDTISKETGLSVNQVRTAIKKLESTNEITSKPTNKNRLITVINYSNYQDDNKQDNKQITNKQQTNNKQITTTNNDNNENNENNDKQDIYIVHFEEFWNLYGIKKGKAKCQAKYKILMRDGVSHDDILAGVRAYQSECIKLETEKEYIKLPLTFLNGRHWEDEYEREQTREEKLAEIQRNIGVLPCALTNS
jgi:hypothetical protein